MIIAQPARVVSTSPRKPGSRSAAGAERGRVDQVGGGEPNQEDHEQHEPEGNDGAEAG
jgi:hypothetical protein